MWQVTAPVALFIFNRPDTTRQVFEAIRRARPPKLLVVADGPRADRADDAAKCQAARSVIDEVDWECAIVANYAQSNLGCKQRITSGLHWVFSLVEKVIILEDDCVPDTTFFRFCDELLSKYRLCEKVMHISGTNPVPHDAWPEGAIASRLVPIWGWATWRRAWRYYEDRPNIWPGCREECNLAYFGKFQKLVEQDIDHYFLNVKDMWSGQWALSCLRNNAISLVPRTNLIQNIGFNQDATHTTTPISLGRVPVQSMSFPLSLPISVEPNQDFDFKCLSQHYKDRQSM